MGKNAWGLLVEGMAMRIAGEKQECGWEEVTKDNLNRGLMNGTWKRRRDIMNKPLHLSRFSAIVMIKTYLRPYPLPLFFHSPLFPRPPDVPHSA